MTPRRIFLFLAVAFLVFLLFTRPAQAAELVNVVIGGIVTGAEQIGVFISNLLS